MQVQIYVEIDLFQKTETKIYILSTIITNTAYCRIKYQRIRPIKKQSKFAVFIFLTMECELPDRISAVEIDFIIKR